MNLKNVKVVAVSAKDSALCINSLKKFKLQKAEIDALYLAKNANLMFLTDDLEARDAANYLRVKVHGSLGIISIAYKKKIISFEEAEKYILDLYNDSTLSLTKSLVDLALRAYRKIT